MSRNKNTEPSLDPDFLLVAYCNGYFPMATSKSGHIEWFSPDPRAIIPIDGFKVSRSLRQAIRRQRFQFTINTEFEAVMRFCGERAETWISEEIVRVYTQLHRLGFAHSIEVWLDARLVGGLYGVTIRGAFFGESMFSREPNASKVALVHLVERLKSRGFSLLDTQFMTEHLRQFGTMEISRSSYLELLAKALEIHPTFV